MKTAMMISYRLVSECSFHLPRHGKKDGVIGGDNGNGVTKWQLEKIPTIDINRQIRSLQYSQHTHYFLRRHSTPRGKGIGNQASSRRNQRHLVVK